MFSVQCAKKNEIIMYSIFIVRGENLVLVMDIVAENYTDAKQKFDRIYKILGSTEPRKNFDIVKQ